jgi:tRNA (guanine37-N1)-methyltransferase
MVVVDSIVRLVEGVIKAQSLAEESFRQGLLEYPQYTRPALFEGRRVPEVLLGGDHARIERWRLEQSVAKTLRYRAELLRGRELPPEVAAIKEELERGQD